MASQATEEPTCSADKGKTWSPMSFYGPAKAAEAKRYEKLIQNNVKDEPQYVVWKTKLPSKYTSLLGPSKTWRVFRKQHEALEFVRMRRNELMTFVYEESSGVRVFLVAHPIFFWYNDIKKSPKDRCSYEVIPEGALSKLYFDLEFEKDYNPGKNGERMTNTFIFIIQHYLDEIFRIHIDRSNILDLDSSTDAKFSRHLIYQIPNAVFRDNNHVGHFVKHICSLIKLWVHKTADGTYPGDFDDPYICNTMNIPDLQELLVVDRKGNNGLFCDESVYTKNRHFRLLGSTKRNKNAHLVLSRDNQYKSSTIETLDIFLDSLLTYFPPEYLEFKLLTFKHDTGGMAEKTEKKSLQPLENTRAGASLIGNSPHPQIDSFISSLVKPGRIYRTSFISSSNRIVYDIVGYRYCGNIQREHCSNNIKYIVNINSATYFQMCHDKDCAGYRSNELGLPYEITFLYNNEEDELAETKTDFEDFDVAEEELNQIVNEAEKAHIASKKYVGSKDDNKNLSIAGNSDTFFEITDQEMIETMQHYERLENSTTSVSNTNQQCPSSEVEKPNNLHMPDVPSKQCDALATLELDQMKSFLENSSDFFEPVAGFFDSSNRKCDLENNLFMGDLNEVELNRVMCRLERDLGRHSNANNDTVAAVSGMEFHNVETFPDYGLSDSELLDIVYPEI